MKDSEHDLIIVGGGIAGMTAAIYAARAGVDVVMLEKAVCGGVANSSCSVENFPSYHAIAGMDLMERIKSHVRSFQVAIEEVTGVESVDVRSRLKAVVAPATVYVARTLIIATGSSPNRLPIETDCDDRVHYCALCDGAAYKSKDVVVVGGGNTGFDESLYLVKLGVRSVLILECLETCRADGSVQRKALSTGRITVRTHSCVNAVVRQSDRLLVTVEDVRSNLTDTVMADGIFVFIGQKPNSDIVKGQVQLDTAGYIVVDELMHTSQPAVFAAGDVTAKRYRQLTTAMADGTIAALEAARYLREC